MTLHPRVSGGTIAWGEAPLNPTLRDLAAAGFTGCGATAPQLAAAPSGAVAAVLADTGLRLRSVCVPAVYSLERPAGWGRETERAGAALELAASLGAGTAVITTGPAGALEFEAASAACAAAVTPLREWASRLGIRLALEPTNSLRDDLGFVYSLRDTLAVAAACGIGVCVDLLWCWREPELAATLAAAGERIELVQVSDCKVGMTSMPCRVVPGDGAIPLERPLRWILEAGYAGGFELELLGPAIDAEGPAAALQRGGAWLSTALTRLGA